MWISESEVVGDVLGSVPPHMTLCMDLQNCQHFLLIQFWIHETGARHKNGAVQKEKKLKIKKYDWNEKFNKMVDYTVKKMYQRVKNLG